MMNLYVDDLRISTLSELKACFKKKEATEIGSHLFNELKELFIDDNLKDFFLALGENDLVERIDGIKARESDSEMMRLLIATITEADVIVEFDPMSCLEVIDTTVKGNQAVLRLKVLHTPHETVDVKLHDPHGSEDSELASNCKKIYLQEYQQGDEIEEVFDLCDYHNSVIWDEAFVQKGYSDEQVVFLIENKEIARKYPVELCNEIGNFFYNGQGVERNYEEAVKWYRKSAEQGYATAQCNLGYCYKNGQGVERNYEEAVKWYRKSAEQGCATAQNNLGYCYKNGQGVERNYEEAVKWYRKSAEQGYATAQCNLGYCYDIGQGVERNYVEAVKWYRKSAEQGDTTAQNNLGICYENGHGVGRNYEEAVKWYRKSAEQGYASAQCNLGDCYEKGQGVKYDNAESLEWYSKSARQGYSPARNKLEEKAKGGSMYAQYELGYLYQFGFGVARDYKEAEKWYRKAIDNALRRSEQWNFYNSKHLFAPKWNPYQDFLLKAKLGLNTVINHLNIN